MFDAEQRTSLTDIQQQQKVVKLLLDRLTTDKIQQLVMIRTSKQYLSRLKRALKQNAGQYDKFLRYPSSFSANCCCCMLAAVLY